MSATANRVWRLGKRPTTTISDDNLSLSTEPVPAVEQGMVLLQTKYLSLDPANRIWMSDRESYMDPVGVGAPMKGIVLAQVAASRADNLTVGDYVIALGNWADYTLAPAADLQKLEIPDGVPLRDHFALMGAVGPTAYIGLQEFGRPKPGETVVVSTAAGAVGSLVGQIARIKGCRTVGITGSAEKCAWITGTLGYDAAINYKTENLDEALARHCPDGVDVFFDNVGGDQLNTVMGRMKQYGRIIECGMIAQYNTEQTVPGPSNYPLVLMNRLKISGFICFDHLELYPAAIKQLTEWISEGKVRYRLDEVDGLENALTAVRKLFDGSNKGKLLVKVSAL